MGKREFGKGKHKRDHDHSFIDKRDVRMPEFEKRHDDPIEHEPHQKQPPVEGAEHPSTQ